MAADGHAKSPPKWTPRLNAYLSVPVPALTATVRSRPKCPPKPETYLSRVGCSKHEVVHAQSFSQVPAVSEWTGHVCFTRLFAKPAGPLEPVEFDDARGHEPRLRRGSTRRHHSQYGAQQHWQLTRRRRVRVAMGRQRLHHRVRRFHPHRRRAGRSHRRQADLYGGLCNLYRCIRRPCTPPPIGGPDRWPQREVDLAGQIAAITALGCLAGAIIEAGAAGWTDSFVLAGFVASAILAALFVLQERRAAQPMLPLTLFRHRMFALTSLVGLLVNVAFYGLIFVFSLYFQRVNGWSPLATGLAFLPMMGAVLLVNLVAARISERIGGPQTIALGAALAAVGCLALLGVASGTSYWEIGTQLVIIGGGLGLLVPPLTSTLLGSVEKSRSGIAAGVLNSTRQTGSVLGVALFGSLIGGSGAFMSGTHQSLVVSALLMFAAGIAIWSGATAKPASQ